MVENLLNKQDTLKEGLEEENNYLNQYTDIIITITELGIRSKIVLI